MRLLLRGPALMGAGFLQGIIAALPRLLSENSDYCATPEGKK